MIQKSELSITLRRTISCGIPVTMNLKTDRATRISSWPTRSKRCIKRASASRRNGAWELASQSYRQALKLLKPEDKEMFNAFAYRLGRVSESLGNNEEAEEHYNAVAGNDCATPEPQ